MKSNTLLWAVIHNGAPVAAFSSRKSAIDAVVRAILLVDVDDDDSPHPRESDIRSSLLNTGSVFVGSRWVVQSIVYRG